LKNKEQLSIENDKFIKCSYRPFDDRYTYFDNKILWRWRVDVMQHFLNGKNIGLITNRAHRCSNYRHSFIISNITDFHITETANANPYIFPLYIYPDEKNKDLFATGQERVPNLNTKIVQQIANKLGLTFTNEKCTSTSLSVTNSFAPIDILDYIYAVLHSPTYREKYKEFLKIDFPRVPYPKAPSPLERAGGEAFWQLVQLGGQLRQIHLLESPIVEKFITQYPIDGNNTVGKPKYQDGKVYINDTQYFDNVPLVAWNFYIGGYQPAQKWLKDRKERKLEFDDILHYQKIIVALTETDRLMKEINAIELE
jgi:predicted helicase